MIFLPCKINVIYLYIKVARTYLFASWLAMAAMIQPISISFGILNKEWSNFKKMQFIFC